MLLLLLSVLTASAPFFPSIIVGSADVMLQGDIGYLTLNSTNSTIATSLWGRTIVAVVSTSADATVGYSTTVNGATQTIPNGGANFGPNTQIRVHMPVGGLVKLAYAGFREGECENLTIVTTKEYTYERTLPTAKQLASHDCLFFAPAAKNLQFDVLNATVEDATDSITFFHQRVNEAWYDRYETIQEPSGWSAISDHPWLIRFCVFRSRSDNPPLSHAKIALRAGQLDEGAIEKEILTSPVPAGKLAVLQHEVAIPIAGCFAPVLLLLSFIFAVWRLWRKVAIVERLEPEE
jgi:hypothetical protein